MNIDFKNLQDKYKALINNEATRNNAFKNSKKNLLEFSNNKNVNIYYAKREKGSPLRAGQKELMRIICATRHYIHSHSENIYLEKESKKNIDKFFILASTLDFYKQNDMPFPIEVYKKYCQLETISSLKNNPDITPEESMRLFHYEKEELNDAFERYINRIDRMYGTNYSVKGKLRDKDLDYEKYEMEKIKRIAKQMENKDFLNLF